MSERDRLNAVPFVMTVFGAAVAWGVLGYQGECTSFTCWEQQMLYGKVALASGVIGLVSYIFIRYLLTTK